MPLMSPGRFFPAETPAPKKQTDIKEILGTEGCAKRHWHIWWIRPEGEYATMSRAYTSRNKANYAARAKSARLRMVWECKLGKLCPRKPE